MASNAVKFGLGGFLILGLAVGGELLYLHHRDAEDAAGTSAPKADRHFSADPDDLVFIRAEHPRELKDEKDLKGRTLWVQAGDQMVYYPYAGHIDFAHKAGFLRGVEPILVKDAVEQNAAKDINNRISPEGGTQVFLIFTRPADTANPTRQYAVPVALKQAGDYNFATDTIFFYSDPHKLFTNWSPEIWKAVDEHRVIPGMNERQTYTSLGQASVPAGDTVGDRSVTYDNQGHPVRVTFVHGKATKIEPVTP